jgi:origin recognition complex subunit 5
MRISSPPHVHFPPYTKAQYLSILTRMPPASLPNTTQQETADLWTRFAAAIHDSLTKPAARTLPRLQQSCALLWPRFTAPVAAGTHKAREFSKLLIAARAYFQDESVIEPGIQYAACARPRVLVPTAADKTNQKQKNSARSSSTDLSSLLPPTARRLLIAAYLASHNAPRHDNALFSTWHTGSKKRRRGGLSLSTTPNAPPGSGRGRKSKHRRIARKLLGPGVFVLERMVAIYVATKQEWIGDSSGAEEPTAAKGGTGGVDGDVGMAIATLASLRLLVRVGGGGAGASVAAGGGADLDRGGKWRVNIGWEIIRGVGRSMGIEVEEWLVE